MSGHDPEPSPFLRLPLGGALPAAVQRGLLSIGNFDGVHRGHRTMMARLVRQARRANCPAIAVTFDPPPLALLRPGSVVPNLTSLTDRALLLCECGVDQVVVLETTPTLLQLTAEEFFERVVCHQFHAAGLVEGPNFFFGRDRQGNITVLRGLCEARGLSLDVIEPVTVQGQWVSSSVIRTLIGVGKLAEAVGLLGHPYRLTGDVVSGARRGRTIGFPTANLVDLETAVPAAGVYAGRCVIDGRTYVAAINIGPNPTFAEAALKVEVHLLDFVGDLYHRRLQVDLLDRVRDVRKFDSFEALREQIAADVLRVREIAHLAAT